MNTRVYWAVVASPLLCLIALAVLHATHTLLGAPGMEGIEQALLASGFGGQR